MSQQVLKIEMPEGKWVVDVFNKSGDSGEYDLIHPNTQVKLALADEMHGFRYNLTGPEGTPFAIYLDDTVIAVNWRTISNSPFLRKIPMAGCSTPLKNDVFTMV